MAPTSPVNRVWESLLDKIFPPTCGGCGSRGAWLCDRCRGQIAYVNSSPGARPPSVSLPNSRLTGLHCAAWHEGPLRKVIHRFKYEGQKALRKPLGEILMREWSTWALPADLVLAVPLHAQREKARGYNQSQLLAEEISQATGLPAPRRALTRIRNTAPQVSLNMNERWENVHGAFQGDGRLLRGHAVLLVDDVCTTGATLEACAQAAFEVGADSIWALTVARPRAPWE